MNPVYQAERRYQSYVIRTNRSSNVAIALALLLLFPALLMSIYSAVAVGILGHDLPPVPIFNQIEDIDDVLYTAGAMTLVTMNLAHYLVVALISSGLAVMSVQREHRNHTWELLVLTRQSARQIAFGKIAASLWVLRRDTAIVTTLRIGLAAFALDFIRPVYASAGHNAGQFLVLAALIVGWTLLDMVLAVSTATASALMPKARAVLMPLALGARGVTLFGGVWWMARVVHLLYAEPGEATFLAVGVAGLAVFAMMAAVSLKIAEISAQFAHATPHDISQVASQSGPPTRGQALQNIPTISQS